MNNEIISGLNEIQKKAVLEIEKPLVICAGAGSGKTRVISYKVAHIVKNLGFCPSSILCVTFTNKAAKEMKERISNLIGKNSKEPTISTFHGFSLKLIRKYGALIGIEDYTIIDEEIRENFIKNIIESFFSEFKEITTKKVSYFISSLKNKTLSRDLMGEKTYYLFYEIYTKYESLKEKSKNLDFDDLLIKCLELVKNKKVISILREEIKHILVDEYQDTNIIQHEIIKKLAQDENKNFVLNSLCIVGDEDQSIYSWRGANVYNMTDFKKDFPTATTITLAQNYRSSKEILSLANEIIKRNTIRNHKELWTEKIISNSNFLFSFGNGYQEANCISRIIKILKEKKEDNIAILYRSHYQSRLFEEELIAQTIPYKIFGGINFYERLEIKDILSYLFLASNLFDRNAFLRCCNTPVRGLGDSFKDEFINLWNNVYDDKNFFEMVDIFIKENQPTIRTANSLLTLGKIIKNITEKKDSPDSIINWLIKEINYETHIQKITETEKEKIEKMENLAELIEAAKVFHNNEGGSIRNFIDQIALMYNAKIEDDNSKNTVLLMSFHSAKGLEFSTVFLVGLEDGIIPNSRNSIELESIEEERRLLYVGITRACNRLILSYANERNVWGTTKSQRKSRFLEKISDFIQFYDFSNIPGYLINNSFEKILFNSSIEKSLNFSYSNSFKEKNNFTSFNFQKKEDLENKNSKFKIYEKVYHETFGSGKILKINNDLYDVLFSVGTKRIKEDFLKKNE